MIFTRDEMLKAVRLAPITPGGIDVGPCAFVAGSIINFSKVVTEDVRRALLTRIKLANKVWFIEGTHWSLPCSEKTKLSPPPTGKKAKPAPKKKLVKSSK